MPNFDHRRIAFQPPSDMTGGSGGSSGTKKVFMVLGVGCGVVLLVIGILFAAGAFKAVSCCNQVQGAYNDSLEARQFGEQFAAHVASGNAADGYAMTSSSFQSSMSKDAFASAIEAHGDQMKGVTPVMRNINLDGANAEEIKDIGKGTWRIQYQFAGPSDTTMLLLSIGVVPKGEGDDRTFVVDEVSFEDRPRNFAVEPPAREVIEVHQLIQQSNYERAYTRMGMGFQQSTSNDAWKQFLKDAGPALTSSTIEIRAVEYKGDQATVMSHARTADGTSTLIQWELTHAPGGVPGLWRVMAIAPMVAETNNDGPDEPVPSMNGTNGSTNQAATNGAAPNGAKAPSVEPKGAEPANP